MSERWMPVPGFGKYEVSDAGNVRVMVLTDDGEVSRKPVHQSISNVGYPCVQLRRDGRAHGWNVHRLVMLAFEGPSDLEVRHLDGTKTNNALANLKYGTRSENNADQVEHGVHGKAGRSACKWGHPYTEENTLWSVTPSTGRPFRRCAICRANESKRASAKAAQKKEALA